MLKDKIRNNIMKGSKKGKTNRLTNIKIRNIKTSRNKIVQVVEG